MEVWYFSMQCFVRIVPPFVVESFAATWMLAVMSYCTRIMVDHVFIQCFFGRIVFVVADLTLPLRLVSMTIFVLVQLLHSHKLRTAYVTLERIVRRIICWRIAFLLLAYIPIAFVNVMIVVFFWGWWCGWWCCLWRRCTLSRLIDRYEGSWIMESWKTIWN